MRVHILFILPLVLLSMVSFPIWGLSMDDMVYREDLYYQKFTDVPLTGEIYEGVEIGALKNGRPDGKWVGYHENGQLSWKGEYQNGELEGQVVSYHDNGQLDSKGDYKRSKREGTWVYFSEDGSKIKFLSGVYRNGGKVSE